jgi:hypothetical protein
MSTASVRAEERIEARPETVYAVLADYRTHHPRIMPPAFSDLRVEEGGVGAGTVFTIAVRVLGRRQRLHMRVAEPEPGRVLTETDLDTGVVTEFAVLPADGGTLARMSSSWETAPGLRGLADRLVRPQLERRTFADQLRRLDRYARSEHVRQLR